MDAVHVAVVHAYSFLSGGLLLYLWEYFIEPILQPGFMCKNRQIHFRCFLWNKIDCCAFQSTIHQFHIELGVLHGMWQLLWTIFDYWNDGSFSSNMVVMVLFQPGWRLVGFATKLLIRVGLRQECETITIQNFAKMFKIGWDSHNYCKAGAPFMHSCCIWFAFWIATCMYQLESSCERKHMAYVNTSTYKETLCYNSIELIRWCNANAMQMHWRSPSFNRYILDCWYVSGINMIVFWLEGTVHWRLTDD